MQPLSIVLALLLSSSTAFAASAVTCHCFKDREYDPARPAASEPYVQATTRNSLLAAAFGVEKGPIVRKLMGGTAPDDLWIGYWVGAKSGVPVERLLEARGERGSWKAALTAADAARCGALFAAALASGASDASLAALCVDDVLVCRAQANADAIRRLRARGAASHDVILAIVLSARARKAPVDLFAEVQGERKTWGAVLQGFGLSPRDVAPEIRKALH